MVRRKKERKRLSLFLKIVIILILILGIIIGTMFFYIKSKLDKIQKVEIPTTHEELGITETVAKQLTGYRNIAIFGIDSREDNYGKGNRSDCIILASLNNDTGEIKLASVYRDTYVKIDGYGLDKITHAYSFGEAPLAIKTLNQNLDLNIKDFVTVNFYSVAKAVDQLGGVQITITSEEVSHINGINAPGTYNLTGAQALAYSRIRYATGGDYKRTERMRTVLEAMLNKLKSQSISQINAFVNVMLPQVYTNLSATDILTFVPNITKYKISESIGWPYNTRGITLDRWYGVPITLESNVIELHKEMFGEENYTPSDTVKAVSQSIINKTGYKN